MGRHLALVACVAWGCYAPRVQTGSPCDAAHPCPHSLVCAATTQTCEVDDSAAAPDAQPPGPDAKLPDAPPGVTCFGSGLVMVCPSAPITMPLSITGQRIVDTNPMSTDCIAYTGTQGLCVLAATTISVTNAGRIVGIGSRPLVLLATQTITMGGTVDVSSRLSGTAGAGSGAATCDQGNAPANRAGGPGGSFGGPGGNGGAGNGAGAPAGAPQIAMTLRGGCAGRDASGATPGRGGRGGGAVALIAGTSMSIAGNVNASGSGGDGGGINSGGGGAGSGGMIVLDAPMITVTGLAFANGGGGGEGGGGANPGDNGSDPTTATIAASGGAGGASAGGDGGAGAAGGANAVTGRSDTESGGGGGGGAGVIKVFPPQALGGSVSPSPS